MKAFYSIVLLFLLASGIFAQSMANPSGAPNLEILQKEWRLQSRNPELDEEDPFRANNELRQAQRDIKETTRRTEIRARQGLPPEPVNMARLRQLEESVLQSEAATSGAFYFYEIKVKNGGEKEIRTVSWDYVFCDPSTGREVGRRQFATEVRIGPGKTKSLVMRSVSPPSGSINAADASKKARDQYAEQIFIQSIEYTDGSVWKAPVASPK